MGITKKVSLTYDEIDLIIKSFELKCLDSGVIFKEQKLVKKLERIKNGTRIKIASAKGKGRALQYWVCRKISELTGIEYKQSSDDSLIRSREMGQHGVDIILRNEAQDKFPFSVECKSSETFNLRDTVNQAKGNDNKNLGYLIVYKCKDFRDPVVIMDWGKFEELLYWLKRENNGKRND